MCDKAILAAPKAKNQTNAEIRRSSASSGMKLPATSRPTKPITPTDVTEAAQMRACVDVMKQCRALPHMFSMCFCRGFNRGGIDICPWSLRAAPGLYAAAWRSNLCGGYGGQVSFFSNSYAHVLRCSGVPVPAAREVLAANARGANRCQALHA